MAGFDWKDFGEGHWEHCLSWKMTGSSRITSVMAQYEAFLMKWSNQWSSITLVYKAGARQRQPGGPQQIQLKDDGKCREIF